MDIEPDGLGRVVATVRVGRMHGVKIVILGGLFVLASLATGHGPIAVAGITFFDIGVVVGLAVIVAPPHLRIAERGFAQYVLWNRNVFFWDRVRDIRVVRATRFRSAVGFNYTGFDRPGRFWASINHAALGTDFVLNTGFAHPEELAERLRVARLGAANVGSLEVGQRQ